MPRLKFTDTLNEFDKLFMNSQLMQEYETLALNLKTWNPTTLQDLLEEEDKITELLVQGKNLSSYETLVARLEEGVEGKKTYEAAIERYQQVKKILPEIEERFMPYIEKGWDEETKGEMPQRAVLQQIAQFWTNIREIVGEKTETKEGREIEEWKEGDQKIETLLREAENIHGQYKQNENWSWREQDVTAFMDEMEATMGRTYDTIMHAVKGKNLYEQTEKERLARIGEIRKEMQEERVVYGRVIILLERIKREEQEMDQKIRFMKAMRVNVEERKEIEYTPLQIEEITEAIEQVNKSYVPVTFSIIRESLKKQTEAYTQKAEEFAEARRALLETICDKMEYALRQIAEKGEITETEGQNAKTIYCCIDTIDNILKTNNAGSAEEYVKRIEEKQGEQQLQRYKKPDGQQDGTQMDTSRRNTQGYQEVNGSDCYNPINKTKIRTRTREAITDTEHPAWVAQQLDGIDEIPVRYERLHEILLEGAQTNPETVISFYEKTGFPAPLSRIESDYITRIESIIKDKSLK